MYCPNQAHGWWLVYNGAENQREAIPGDQSSAVIGFSPVDASYWLFAQPTILQGLGTTYANPR